MATVGNSKYITQHPLKLNACKLKVEPYEPLRIYKECGGALVDTLFKEKYIHWIWLCLGIKYLKLVLKCVY